MAAHYLQQRSGERMPAELRAYYDGRRLGQERAKQLNEVHQELEAVYDSAISDAEKYEKKRQIIDRLMQQMRLVNRPNNATLIGFKLYHVGRDDFSELFAACGYSWRRFLAAAGSLKSQDFGEPQRAEFGPVVAALRERGCPTEVRPLRPFSVPDRRWRSKQRRRMEAIHRSVRLSSRAVACEPAAVCSR
jgi:hypothetical protein